VSREGDCRRRDAGCNVSRTPCYARERLRSRNTEGALRASSHPESTAGVLLKDAAAKPVEFTAVEVVRIDDLIAMCRIGNRIVGVPTRWMLSGTDIAQVGDRGRLVIGREMALNLELI
jgi:hypothetical protein